MSPQIPCDDYGCDRIKVFQDLPRVFLVTLSSLRYQSFLLESRISPKAVRTLIRFVLHSVCQPVTVAVTASLRSHQRLGPTILVSRFERCADCWTERRNNFLWHSASPTQPFSPTQMEKGKTLGNTGNATKARRFSDNLGFIFYHSAKYSIH